MGTSRKRPSKVNKISSKRLKQPKYVFVRLINHDKEQKINVGENRRDNQEWTIHRNWHHWAHTTQDTRRGRAKETTQHNIMLATLHTNKHK